MIKFVEFAPLHTHSHFSLIGKGPIAAIPSPHQLVKTAKEKGYSYVGQTDPNFFGLGRFMTAAKDADLKAIPGLELPVDVDLFNRTRITIYPKDNKGLEKLFALATKLNRDGETVKFDDLKITDGDVIVFLHEPVDELLAAHDLVFLAINHPSDKTIRQLVVREDRAKKAVVASEVRMTSPAQVGVLKLLLRLFKEPEPGIDQAKLLNYNLKSPLEITSIYTRLPKAVGRSVEVAQSIDVELPSFPKMKAKIVPEATTSIDFLTNLIWQAWQRYPDKDALKGRVETEIDLIKQLDFADYILISFEIAQFCQEKDIPFLTTGSGNNSLVLALLGLTEVDASNLSLDRFMNLSRKNLPDIDIQVPYHKKWEVTNYLLRRYKESSQLLAIIRHLHEAGINQLARRTKAEFTPEQIKELASWELPYQVSVHPGVIFAGRLAETKSGHSSFAQIDKTDADDLYQLAKIDILASFGLAYLEDTLALLRRDGITVEFPDVNQAVLTSLFNKQAAIGITNLESPHLRRLLTIFAEFVTEPTLTHLADALALARLAASTRGEYFSYFNNGRNTLSQFASNFPEIKQVLEKTNFVAIYQEQIIDMATKLARLDDNTAERVRKMMSERVPLSEKQALVELLNKSFVNFYPLQVVKELIRQVTNFTSYGFVEGHALALARLSFKLAYLTDKFPAHFFTAVLKIASENETTLQYPLQTYINAALKSGVTFIFPSVNHLPYQPQVVDQGKNKQVLIGKKLFRDEDYFDFAYGNFWQLLNNKTTSIKDLIFYQFNFFDRVYTHNPLVAIKPNFRFQSEISEQEIVAMFVNDRTDNQRHFVTLESANFIDLFVNPSELQLFYQHLYKGFCHLQIKRIPGIFPTSWEIVKILPVTNDLFLEEQ